uniref:Uncharacterized protein n=1 Tax=Myoviridae sp. ct25F5 TaxID=2826604 RepID=A0A8S5LT84_9CAUD|nr:MAG TPA: hypothetical protein [Myoviridae sp. ct25F5]
MHKLRDVDAVCTIQAWMGYECEIYHELLPTLWEKDDRNADVRKLQIWSR